MSSAADNLRSKDLQHVNEALNKLEISSMEEKALREASEQKIQRTMEIMMENLSSLQESLKDISQQLQETRKNTSHFLPEVKFPLFDGSNPRAWVRKCQMYFKLVNNSLSPENRVPLAFLHFSGEAEVWILGYMEGKSDVSWETFVEAVMERFDDFVPRVIVGEFRNLQQEGAVSEYVDKFEECMSRMILMFGRGLGGDKFYVDSFVSGLKDEIRAGVMAMRPETLRQAVRLAKLQESMVDAIIRRADLDMEDDEGDVDGEPVAGNVSAGPLTVMGEIENFELRIVIGCGSTHCFLDEEFAKKLQSERRYTTPVMVNVGFGGKVVCRVICPNLKWKIQGNEFVHPVRVIKLGLCDMLLGGDWLSKYSPEGFSLGEGKITLYKDGKNIELQTITEPSEPQWICCRIEE